MPPRKDPIREAFQEVQALRKQGVSESAIAKLKTMLIKKNGMVVAKVAGLIAEWYETSLAENLEQCFFRLSNNGIEDDPQCWGKTAIVSALYELAWQDTKVYVAGCKTVQLEPVRGGREDTATALRIASFQALMQLPIIDNSVAMPILADLLADDNKQVRAEAARLSVQGSTEIVAPLLRLKIRIGDTDSRVMGICFDALLAGAPTQDTLTLLQSYTQHKNEALQAEALAALASSHLDDAIKIVKAEFSGIVDAQLKRIILTAMGASSSREAIEFLTQQLSEAIPQASWALESLKPKLHDEDIKESIQRQLEKGNTDLLETFYRWTDS